MRRILQVDRLPQILFLLIFAGATFIRLQNLNEPGFWYDEIQALRQSESIPVFSFQRKAGPDTEHGPLYHSVLALAGSAGASEFSARLPFALAGCITIPLLYFAAARAYSPAVGLLAAILLAVSPIHIFHSRDARPYAFLILEMVTALLALIQLSSGQNKRFWLYLFLTMCGLLLLTSSQGILYVAVLLILFAVYFSKQKDTSVRFRIGVLGGIALGVLLLYALLYLALFRRSAPTVGAPDLTLDLVERMIHALTSSYAEWEPVTKSFLFLLFCLLIGVYASVREKGLTIHFLLAAILGLGLPWTALQLHNHWITPRYLLISLPALLFLQALGIHYVVKNACRILTPRMRIVPVVLSLVMLGLCILQSQNIQRAIHGRADWRQVARKIQQFTNAGDLVVTSNRWTHVCLAHHLSRLGIWVRLKNIDESIPFAMKLLKKRKYALLVSGGFHSKPEVRERFEQYPSLYHSELEQIQVSCFPNLLVFWNRRMSIDDLAEQQEKQLKKQGGNYLHHDLSPLLLQGWGNSETDPTGKPFRWIEGQDARLLVPVLNEIPKQLSVSALPFAGVKTQDLTVKINGKLAGSYRLNKEINRLVIALGESRMKRGMNILEFHCTQQARPSDTIKGADDRRNLSAAIFSLVIR